MFWGLRNENLAICACEARRRIYRKLYRNHSGVWDPGGFCLSGAQREVLVVGNGCGPKMSKRKFYEYFATDNPTHARRLLSVLAVLVICILGLAFGVLVCLFYPIIRFLDWVGPRETSSSSSRNIPADRGF